MTQIFVKIKFLYPEIFRKITPINTFAKLKSIIKYFNLNFTMETNPQTTFTMKWTQADGFVYGDAGTTPSDKILALDMDDTLIKIKSGKKSPIDENDWLLLNEFVATTLQEYHSKGFKIIIISNQAGVQKGTAKIETIQKKIELVMEAIGLPMQAFIATHRNYYRKPSPGLWKFMCEKLNGDVKVDMKESVFCGDAAGRPGTNTKEADFENTDYKFALNCGLNFKTPEMLYENIHEDLPDIEFHPKTLKGGETGQMEAELLIKKNNTKEMIIFVGPPPSGKTTFYKNYLANDYVHVNNNEYKIKEEFIGAAEKIMKEGKSLVIDNLNHHNENRKDYLDLAKKYEYNVRAFVFDVDEHLARHLNHVRMYNPHRKHDSKPVTRLVITNWFKEYVEPSVEEGFDSVEKIKFVAGPFENQNDEEMFFSYLCTMN